LEGKLDDGRDSGCEVVCIQNVVGGKTTEQLAATTKDTPGITEKAHSVPLGRLSKAKVHPLPALANFNSPKTAGADGASDLAIHVSASAGTPSMPDDGVRPHSSVFDLLERSRARKKTPWQQKIGVFLDGPIFTVISIIFTLLVRNCSCLHNC